jgi:CRP/FNR family transcriptional regulator, nitrogen oxide reductase regulator
MPERRSQATDLTDRLLAGIEPGARRAILAGSHRRTIQPSQVLCRTGEPADRLFLLRKGRVRLGRLSSTGREVVLGILGPGDMFGLGSVLAANVDYMATAEVMERGEALIWTRDVIQRFAAGHPQIAGNVLHVALRYLAMFAERHERLLSRTAEQRLAHVLMRLASRSGVPSGPAVHIEIKNEQLASLADVSPFTTSRQLKDWERNGAVSKTRGAVDIICPEKLLLD